MGKRNREQRAERAAAQREQLNRTTAAEVRTILTSGSRVAATRRVMDVFQTGVSEALAFVKEVERGKWR